MNRKYYEYLTGPGQFICYCGQVTEDRILEALDSGAKNIREICAATGAMPVPCNCKELNPKGT